MTRIPKKSVFQLHAVNDVIKDDLNSIDFGILQKWKVHDENLFYFCLLQHLKEIPTKKVEKAQEQILSYWRGLRGWED